MAVRARQPVLHGGGDPFTDTPTDKAAASDLAAHPALALQFLVGVGHRLHADVQLLGQQPLRWESLAILQLTPLDIGRDGRYQQLVLRSAAMRKTAFVCSGSETRRTLRQKKGSKAALRQGMPCPDALEAAL